MVIYRGFSLYPQCLLKDLLGIPPEMEVYDMMALGYPAARPRTKLLRDKDRMVHYDRTAAGKISGRMKRSTTISGGPGSGRWPTDRRGVDKRMLG